MTTMPHRPRLLAILAVVRAANALTGRSHNREGWEAPYAENRANLGKLLPE